MGHLQKTTVSQEELPPFFFGRWFSEVSGIRTEGWERLDVEAIKKCPCLAACVSLGRGLVQHQERCPRGSQSWNPFSPDVLLEEPLVEGGSQDETYPWDDEMEVDDAVDESRVIPLLDAADEEAERAERAVSGRKLWRRCRGSSGLSSEEAEAEASRALSKAERSGFLAAFFGRYTSRGATCSVAVIHGSELRTCLQKESSTTHTQHTKIQTTSRQNTQKIQTTSRQKHTQTNSLTPAE